MKKISVIIPCYNAVLYLDAMLQSILNQTIGLDALEIICVNDASTDATYEMLLDYEKKFPDTIMVINLDENGRQGTARNIGMSYASGEYIGFVDADDYIDVNMFKTLYEKAKKYDLDMAGGLVLHHEYGIKTIMPNHLKTNQFIEITDPRGRMDMILNGNNGGLFSKIYKRKMIFEHDLFFPQGTYYEDNFWLPITCLYINKYFIVNDVVYHYIDHETSTVNLKRNDKAMQDRMNMEIQKLGAYAKRGFLKEYFIGIEAMFCRSFYVDTLITIYATWGEVPMNYYEQLRGEVQNLFPKCQENTMLIPKDRKLLETAFKKVTQEKLHEMILDYARC